MRAALRALGPRRLRPAVLAVTFVLLLVGGSLLAASLVPPAPARVLRSPFLASAQDADADGMPDAFENRFGSDPARAATLGSGVPDGWLFRWYGPGLDWNDTALLERPALQPPPEALPVPLRRSSLSLPTVAQLFAAEDKLRKDPFWWEQGGALDPARWDNNGDGIADAWALLHGLDALALRPDDPAPGDPSLTLRAKYEHGLDPRATDSDRDGLSDREELDGRTQAGDPFRPTDPALFATAGTGVPDGYLVRLGLDPLDPASAGAAPGRDGLTVQRAYNVTVGFCRSEPGCVLPTLLRSGAIVDPRVPDSNGDGIPDAWALAAGPPAHPLRDGRLVPVTDAQAWDAKQWDGDTARLTGLVVDGHNPKPADAALSLLDFYAHGRPAGWDEARDGAWWGGLLPNVTQAPGALPVAVGVRGWQVATHACRGCSAANPGAQTVAKVFADPRRADSDGDGLSDAQEYFGVTATGRGARTDPRDRDTDRDGLEDQREAELRTDPIRRDTPGAFLTDGEAHAYWKARHARAQADLEDDVAEAGRTYAWLVRPGEGLEEALARLLPTGSVLGTTPNLLNNDTDADGLRTGAEVFPNRFLDIPSGNARPATDPARADSDGDGLPDGWEVRWSQDRYFNCSSTCEVPPGFNKTLSGWPLDPTLFNSFRPGTGLPGDLVLDLSGDHLLAAPLQEASFSNALAHRFDLNPYLADFDGDGLSNLFELHWGFLGLSDERHRGLLGPGLGLLDALEQKAEADPDRFGWLRAQAARLAARMPAGQQGAPRVAVFDPTSAVDGIGPNRSLTEAFTADPREKGTWVASRQPCGTTVLPAQGLRGERALGNVPARAGLPAPCWTWLPYPLSSDVGNRTDPWLHDFDDDGLPDAWEAHYGPKAGADAAALTPGSVAGGCEDPALARGLPDRQPCLTYAESYRLGLDPQVADSDGGGLADWLEVALQALLDPLNADDDHGEEDWDGDGLPNRVEAQLRTLPTHPDTDGDGLLDGDPVGIERLPFLEFGKGDGGACVPDGSAAFPGMAHRPPYLGGGDPGGSLTHRQVRDHLVALGVLHDSAPGTRCPGPELGLGTHWRFEREVAFDRWSTPPVRLGARTSPTQLDSRGDGIPDGWLVHWASRTDSDSVRQDLDPDPSVARGPDPDRDGLSTAIEYARGRPADWKEKEDGVWWGGSDPTRRDTDGDEPWFDFIVEGQDLFDPDTDGDGIPEPLDAWPGLDSTNAGLVTRSADGRYGTQSPAVWAALEQRRTAFRLDGDLDRVPDFLDRARVRVTVDEGLPAVAGLTKGDATPFRVAGLVLLDEAQAAGAAYTDDGGADGSGCPHPAPPDAACPPVGGATVKLVLDDGANEAVLGAAVTGTDGRYTLWGSLGPTFTFDPVGRATMEGRRVDLGPGLEMPTGMERILPGRVSLRVVVEPNEPTWQVLSFGGAPEAKAYKDTQGATRFRIPTGDPAQAGPLLLGARLTADRSGPDLQAGHVLHDTKALFAASSPRQGIDLSATTSLALVLPPERVLAGQAIQAAATLQDAQGAKLEGRPVRLQLLKDGVELHKADGLADPDGAFAASLPTAGLPPGQYSVRASATLLGGDTFLAPPDAVERALTLSQDAVWKDDLFLVRGDPAFNGSRVAGLAADAPLEVRGTLVDRLDGAALGGRPVTATLHLGGSRSVTLHAVTRDAGDEKGVAVFSLPRLPPGAPAEDLKMDITAATVTAEDRNQAGLLFLRPHFPTRVVAQPATGKAGDPVWVVVALQYDNGTAWRRAHGGGGAFEVQGEGTRFSLALGADGSATWNTTSDLPRAAAWTVRFRGPADGFFATSAPVQVTADHTSATTLRIVPAPVIRGEPAVVRGALQLADGRPAAGAVQVRWSGGEWVQAQAGPDGSWAATLPAPQAPGRTRVLATFAGTPLLAPASAEAELDVRRATRFVLPGRSIAVDADGTAAGTLAGRLLDDEGHPLVGERLLLELAGPGGARRSIEGVSGPDGAFAVGWDALAPAPPGPWKADLRFAGGARHAPAALLADVWIEHRNRLEVLQFPTAVASGGTASVLGRTLGPTGGPAQVRIVFPVGYPHVLPQADKGWHATVQVPDLLPGSYRVRVEASGAANATYVPAEAPFAVLEPAEAQVSEAGASDGGRNVTVVLQKKGQLLPGTGLVLVRRDEAGNIIGIHEARTDGRGEARLHLAPSEAGTLTVAYVADPTVQLVRATYSSTLVPAAAPVTVARDLVPFVAGGATLAVGAAVVAAYALWRRRHLAALAGALDEAAAGLLDPNAPPRQVIRAAYARILRILAAAGFQPSAADTVQDIAQAATAALRLPQAPMRAVSLLFERAIYSTEPLDERDRGQALDAFRDLRAALGGRQAAGGAS